MFNLEAIQREISQCQNDDAKCDGWLLADFRGSNVLANRVLDFPDSFKASRRWFYFIPASGAPQKLVHKIESGALDHLPGEKQIYLHWQELRDGLQGMLRGAKRVAMEYSPMNDNPYISRVDAGTVELVRSFGVDVVSSGDLVQAFEARWSDEEWHLHQQADQLNQAGFDRAWSMIAEHVRAGKALRETDVQDMVMQYYADNNMTTYSPPIVGVGPHSGDPHYSPQKGQDAEIKAGEFILLDMWAKMDVPNGVYSDLTKVGFVGDRVPEEYSKIFDIVAAARDAGIDCARTGLRNGAPIYGWQIDQATRDVIAAAGYGDYFIHRTGHNIGRETHGNGAHMDNLETRETRTLMPRTCFSIEPGIYLPEFGVRSEINVYVDEHADVHVTGGLQTEVLAILG